RGDRRHRLGVAEPALPGLRCPGDRVEGQIQRLGHRHKLSRPDRSGLRHARTRIIRLRAVREPAARTARAEYESGQPARTWTWLITDGYIACWGTSVDQIRGKTVRSAHAVTPADPVLAAGIGVRRGMHWNVPSLSFRGGPPMPGKSALGILIAGQGQATAMIDVLE